MILSEARTRLLRLVDDETDRSRFPTDGELDNALGTGQQEAWSAAVMANRSMFTQETLLSTLADGSLALTTIKPMMPLGAVSENANGWRLKCSPGRLDDGVQNALGIRQLRIAYVPRAIFPALATDAFVWGSVNITQTNLLDQLMLVCAAGELMVKVGAVNPALEKRKDELRVAVAATLSGTGWTTIPLDNLTGMGAAESFYQYVMTAPDVLQLVIRRW